MGGWVGGWEEKTYLGCHHLLPIAAAGLEVLHVVVRELDVVVLEGRGGWAGGWKEKEKDRNARPPVQTSTQPTHPPTHPQVPKFLPRAAPSPARELPGEERIIHSSTHPPTHPFKQSSLFLYPPTHRTFPSSCCVVSSSRLPGG